MSSLQAALPDLHVEHGRIFIPEIGPPAAFRLLTIKEARGYLSAVYVDDLWLTDAIIKRTILFPSYEEYEEAPTHVHSQVAAELLDISYPMTAEKVSEELATGKESLDEWIEAMVFLISMHMDIPREKLYELQHFELMTLVAGLETQLKTSFDPTKPPEGSKTPPDRIRKAQAAHDRALSLQRSQAGQEVPSPEDVESFRETQKEVADGQFVVKGSESLLNQDAAHARLERWKGIEEGMAWLDKKGKDPTKVSLTSIYVNDPFMSKLTSSSLGKSNLTIQTLPLDIMAAVKYIRKGGSKSGLDFDKLTYLGE